MKVAIIGAGAAGLVAIRYSIEEGYECEAFEQTELIGGTWNYTDEVGFDKNGLPVHTSMYKNLRTNLPKEVMMFENFPYKETIKNSYITQEEVLEYLNDYAEKKDLKKYIKFNSLVTHVEPISKNKWNIEIQNVLTKEKQVKIFDAVVVCNGKYEVPYIPHIPGLENFDGNWIHSHDFRSVDPYRNKIVLVVGGGPSGLDIANHLQSVAKKVFLSFKTSSYNCHVPSGPIKKFATTKIDTNNYVHFEDGTSEEVDAIVLCTGYKYVFPFLSEKCKVVVDDNYVKGLYKECLCIEYPSMIFLGLPGSVCPIPTFELQMRFFFEIQSGRFNLASKEDMLKDSNDKREAKDCTNRVYHKKGVKDERNYWDELSTTASVKGVPNVVTKLHELVFKQKRDASKNFRILNDEEFEEIM